MRVRTMSVPAAVAALSAEFGSVAMLAAGGREVAASTLRHDDRTGFAERGQSAVWMAVPVARDVLLAAWMLDGMALGDLDELHAMDDDKVRETAIHALVMAGTSAAQEEIRSAAFVSGYRSLGADVAEYAAALAARLDRVLFDTQNDQHDQAGALDTAALPVLAAASVPAQSTGGRRLRPARGARVVCRPRRLTSTQQARQARGGHGRGDHGMSPPAC